MFELDSRVSASLEAAAQTFLDRTEFQELPGLIRSLHRVYIARALGVEPGISHDEASARLIKIALALESELFAQEKSDEDPSQDTIESYDILARIFEYAARILDQRAKQNTEYWLRASVAFSLAEHGANSAVSARRYLTSSVPSFDYASQVKEISCLFLARDMRSVIDGGVPLYRKLAETAFDEDPPESAQDRLRQSGALNLLGALVKVAGFLLDGNSESLDGWNDLIARGGRLLHESGDPLLDWIASRLGRVCSNLVKKSLWTYRSLIPAEYIKVLTNHPTHPIVELWTSQTQGVEQTLGAQAHPHQTIVMPTSAGKTLVAQMIIAKELLNFPGNAFYVAPTRALVNEITETMSRYLPDLGLEVVKIPGDYEYVPSLDDVFAQAPRVYVLTPEKLDLLWRTNDGRLSSAKVFVFDEAQLLREGGRGLRLELLISKIRSNFGHQARILLLSAVIPSSNIAEFTDWLGKQHSDGLKIDWKPTRNLEAYFFREMMTDWRGTIHYFGRFNIDNVLPPERNATNRDNVVKLAWKYQMYLGPVLIYCSSRASAESIALALYELARKRGSSQRLELDNASKRVQSILGKNFPLATTIRYGVAYHHASLPDPIRQLVEQLARNGSLNILACTSTLAEGVNLNVGTVIVSTPFAGDEPIDGAKLRNLAGRAGRAFKDTEGHIIVLHNSLQQMLTQDESSRIFSRFFEYMSKMREKPAFNDEIDVVEAELLARVYRKQLSNDNVVEHTAELLGATFFSRQGDEEQISSVGNRINQQARAILAKQLVDQAQLQVFAVTGLNLDFCQRLDIAAGQFAARGDLFFRENDDLNWKLLAEVVSKCLLESERLDAAARKKLKNQIAVVEEWMRGRSILELTAIGGIPSTNQNLAMLSNYLYGYVADDVSWACAAFVRLLNLRVVNRAAYDVEWDLLPTYIRLGISTPRALLLMAAGLNDRDLANKLGEYHSGFRGDEASWVREINWVFSLDPAIGESLRAVQDSLRDRLGYFVIPAHFKAKLTGTVDVADDGRILVGGKEIGLIDPTFFPILNAIRKRGFHATVRSEVDGRMALEIAPSLTRRRAG